MKIQLIAVDWVLYECVASDRSPVEWLLFFCRHKRSNNACNVWWTLGSSIWVPCIQCHSRVPEVQCEQAQWQVTLLSESSLLQRSMWYPTGTILFFWRDPSTILKLVVLCSVAQKAIEIYKHGDRKMDKREESLVLNKYWSLASRHAKICKAYQK